MGNWCSTESCEPQRCDTHYSSKSFFIDCYQLTVHRRWMDDNYSDENLIFFFYRNRALNKITISLFFNRFCETEAAHKVLKPNFQKCSWNNCDYSNIYFMYKYDPLTEKSYSDQIDFISSESYKTPPSGYSEIYLWALNNDRQQSSCSINCVRITTSFTNLIDEAKRSDSFSSCSVKMGSRNMRKFVD